MRNERMRRIVELLKWLLRRDQKITRLYEQGASKERAGAYLRWWLMWVGVGLLIGCTPSWQIKSLGDETIFLGSGGYVQFKLICDGRMNIKCENIWNGKYKKWVSYTMYDEGKIGVDMEVTTRIAQKREKSYKCGEIEDLGVIKYKCVCYGDPMRMGCTRTYELLDFETKRIRVDCGGNPSCLVINKLYGVLEKFYRGSGDEYMNIINQISERIHVVPDEKINVISDKEIN